MIILSHQSCNSYWYSTWRRNWQQ